MCALPREPRRLVAVARQRGDLVAGADERRDHESTDRPCPSRHEHLHLSTSWNQLTDLLTATGLALPDRCSSRSPIVWRSSSVRHAASARCIATWIPHGDRYPAAPTLAGPRRRISVHRKAGPVPSTASTTSSSVTSAAGRASR